MVTPMQNPEFLYKIASAESYDAAIASGRFTGMPIDIADGYIHFSTAGQLRETLALHFRGQSGVIVFSVRTYDAGAGLRWETSRGGQLFPHLYGAFPMSAVGDMTKVDVDSDGAVDLPDWVR